MTSKIIAVLAAIGLLSTQGCAAVGLTLFSVGAGVSAGTGVSYTLDSIAYKTFTAPLEGVHHATRTTLGQMDITVQEDQPTESGRKLVAAAGDRTIEIELDRLTTQTARMRVNAKQGWFFKDRATATEIIVQTARTLEEASALSQKPTRRKP
jgi:Protein of unknown function (DUF3568)